MSQFEQHLHRWFARDVKSSAVNFLSEYQFALGTDIGSRRSQNQDRVAALHSGINSRNPIFAFAVVDGMGGMQDGAQCANIAISGFFFSLLQNRHLPFLERCRQSVIYANNSVANFANQNGGATLSAIVFDKQHPPALVHVGDSRIFTYGNGQKLSRKTTDDSLQEALGGSGRELLQFVGMGDSIAPKVEFLSYDAPNCFISTDGIHCIDESTLSDVLSNAQDFKQTTERLIAIARWIGGRDNATSALFNIDKIASYLSKANDHGIRIWDPFGELTTQWLKSDDPPQKQKVQEDEDNKPDNVDGIDEVINSRRPKKQYKRKQNKKSNENGKSSVQLKIEMDGGDKDEKENNDSE